MTDLLAPIARTQVMSSVMPKAIKSGGLPVSVDDFNQYCREPEALEPGIWSQEPGDWSSQYSPNIVPMDSLIVRAMALPVRESKLELNAQAQALVPVEIRNSKQSVSMNIETIRRIHSPIRYSNIMFQPIIKATNSPTATYEYI